MHTSKDRKINYAIGFDFRKHNKLDIHRFSVQLHRLKNTWESGGNLIRIENVARSPFRGAQLFKMLQSVDGTFFSLK
jgi:hypothetical protein